MKVAFSLCALGLFGSAIAATPAEAAFSRLKSLKGEWQMGTGEKSIKAVYRLTGGGSTVVEVLFPGTEHEMTTTYYMDGDRLLLTHYCASHNQPTMRYVKGKSPDVLDFDFVSGTNMKPGDLHMHHLKVKLLNNSRLDTTWTLLQGGKSLGDKEFHFQRVGD